MYLLYAKTLTKDKNFLISDFSPLFDFNGVQEGDLQHNRFLNLKSNIRNLDFLKLKSSSLSAKAKPGLCLKSGLCSVAACVVKYRGRCLAGQDSVLRGFW
jgi:hypothetical protein